MIDTLNILNDTLKLELISQMVSNDTIVVKQLTGHPQSVLKDFIPFFTSIIGIGGIILGYLLNNYEHNRKSQKERIKFFKEQILKYKKGEVSYDELLIYYYDLPTTIKKKNTIEKLKTAKPDEIEEICHEILTKI